MGAELNWRTRALCDGMDPDEIDVTFFPHPNDNGADAKKICRQCPVASECLTYALETRQEFGVWGAMTEQERHAIRPPLRANGVEAARCGSPSGYKRHRRLGEDACAACLAAKAESTRAEYAKRQDAS